MSEWIIASPASRSIGRQPAFNHVIAGCLHSIKSPSCMLPAYQRSVRHCRRHPGEAFSFVRNKRYLSNQLIPDDSADLALDLQVTSYLGGG